MVLASYVSAGLTPTKADGRAVRALLYLDYKTAKTAQTACDPAVFPDRQTAAAQDFRRERDGAG